jgi:tetratricopeptide (TPR) repeat protein
MGMFADCSELGDRGSAALEAGDPAGALAYFERAESVAGGDARCLCPVLGDKAVALRRTGDIPGAIDTYRRAIDACRGADSPLDLSRWLNNLFALLLERDERAASKLVPELLDAAARAGEPETISIAAARVGSLLVQQGRFSEAADRFEAAEAASPDPQLSALWRQQRVQVQAAWGERLVTERRGKDATGVLERGLALIDETDDEQVTVGVRMAMLLAHLYEQAADGSRLNRALSTARTFAAAGGDTEMVSRLDELLAWGATAGQLGTEVAASDRYSADYEAADQAGDQNAKLTALVNRATALLSEDDDRAFGAFEQAMAEVRRRHDQRRELILSLNFAVPLLERGDVVRAVKVADRGVEIARGISGDRLALALLVRGKIRLESAGDKAEAQGSFAEAVDVLASAGPAGRSIVEAAPDLLAVAARTLLDEGDVGRAQTVVELFGVQ